MEFQLVEDAAAAMDNMNESELFGRTICVNIARPKMLKKEALVQYGRKILGFENTLARLLKKVGTRRRRGEASREGSKCGWRERRSTSCKEEG